MDIRLTVPADTLLDGSYCIVRVVGMGGFGVTYEAEDVNLGTRVAIKEYYPLDFGDRDDVTMSVGPKSERHRETFDWGRSSFLTEARTLARFEHPSIVRVWRVFEANSTAYMVMRFEEGKSLEAWLRDLGRPPTQEQLDCIVVPLLEALETMHAQSFLHRDIAPDNIIVRPDGTPVLLDFGTARRAVAEMTRGLTSIVKSGYSPPEQYGADNNRRQGPWSDLYALGGTLYRAVSGKAPDESTQRFFDDQLVPATQAARGSYRRGFLTAIDVCLKIRHTERFQSVAELRPMLLGSDAKSATRYFDVRVEFRVRDEGQTPLTGARVALEVEGEQVGNGVSDETGLASIAIAGDHRGRAARYSGELAGFENARGTIELGRETSAEIVMRRRPTRPSWPWGKLAAGAGAVVVAIATAIYFVMRVTVPSVVGQEEDRAYATLKQHNLKVGTISTMQQIGSKRGTVLDQVPKPQNRVARGTAVDLVIAAVPPVRIPSLLQMNERGAADRLRELGLRVAVSRQPRPGVSAGTIVEQRPQPGEEVETGTWVNLVIAVAPRVKVPSLVQLDVRDAESRLRASGLRLGSQASQPRSGVPAGKIIEQQPRADEEVEQDTAVNVVIAAVLRVKVPSLVQKDVRVVENLLRDTGLRLGRVTSQARSGVSPGTIIEQQPRAGEDVAQETEVSLVVAGVPSVKGPSRELAEVKQAMDAARHAAEQAGAKFWVHGRFVAAQNKEQEGKAALDRGDHMVARDRFEEARSEYRIAVAEIPQAKEDLVQLKAQQENLEEAHRTADERRKEAMAAGAESLARDAFNGAQAKQREGDNRKGRKELVAAAQAYRDATRLYEEAIRQARPR